MGDAHGVAVLGHERQHLQTRTQNTHTHRARQGQIAATGAVEESEEEEVTVRWEVEHTCNHSQLAWNEE